MKAILVYTICGLMFIVSSGNAVAQNFNSSNSGSRNTISLNGKWEVAETVDTIPPKEYFRTVQVPGLLDMAKPAFDSVGYVLDQPKSNDYTVIGKKSIKRNYFWYKKNISSVRKSDFAYLKIHKAFYGVAVYINGHYVGKDFFCFTPLYFEISKLLNSNANNEIVVRVGATPEELPKNIPWGRDWEKAIYYPGLWDNVEIYAANFPYIKNIQAVPHIAEKKIRLVATIENEHTDKNFQLEYSISDKKTKKIIATGFSKEIRLQKNQKIDFDFSVAIPNCQLWSPESPFLYELTLKTSGDTKRIVFGMREFKIDPKTNLAMLNGKPCYLRGTNVAMQRFLEDTARKYLPWNRKWVEKMHDEFKDMNFNSYRFHVGFAPELWYEVADEKGILVQDEYPIWGFDMDDGKGFLDTIQHSKSILTAEFTRWMQERWNHPSLAIWDACNETTYKITGEVIDELRGLDLSNRPWDNGYNDSRKATDVRESHPYLLCWGETNDDLIWKGPQTDRPKGGVLKREFIYNPEPLTIPLKPKLKTPVIVNEYGWLWLYRDGSTGTVAKPIWDAYPEMNTVEKRWDMRGRFIAAMTEYWRSKREIIGVQYFCALTCNRPWGERPSQVSDEWKDLRNLVIQPAFKKYVKPAFAPVGIMIKKWDNAYRSFEKIEVPVVLINDLNSSWNGEITFEILKNGKLVYSEKKKGFVKAINKAEISFNVKLPDAPGDYEMIASIKNKDIVFSSRLFSIEKLK